MPKYVSDNLFKAIQNVCHFFSRGHRVRETCKKILNQKQACFSMYNPVICLLFYFILDH